KSDPVDETFEDLFGRYDKLQISGQSLEVRVIRKTSDNENGFCFTFKLADQIELTLDRDKGTFKVSLGNNELDISRLGEEEEALSETPLADPPS
ncbi:MAG: hypothetical protein AAB599_02885, partial [Patescibacteria group bacterium]